MCGAVRYGTVPCTQYVVHIVLCTSTYISLSSRLIDENLYRFVSIFPTTRVRVVYQVCYVLNFSLFITTCVRSTWMAMAMAMATAMHRAYQAQFRTKTALDNRILLILVLSYYINIRTYMYYTYVVVPTNTRTMYIVPCIHTYLCTTYVRSRRTRHLSSLN